MHAPTVIYQQFHSKMTKVNKAKRPNNVNFLIKWREMDWSDFRTLAECEKQFGELEGKPNSKNDEYQVVETYNNICPRCAKTQQVLEDKILELELRLKDLENTENKDNGQN